MTPSERLNEITNRFYSFIAENPKENLDDQCSDDVIWLINRVKVLTEALEFNKEACWDGYNELQALTSTATQDSLWSDQFAVLEHLKLAYDKARKALEGDE